MPLCRLARRALLCAACLSLGLLTTIASAWLCAGWSTINPSTARRRTAPTLPSGLPDLASLGPVASLIDPDWQPHAGPAHTVSAVIEVQRGLGLRDTHLTIMYWAHGEGSGNSVVTLHGAGWPLLALSCTCILRGNAWVWESSWSPPAYLVRRAYPIAFPVNASRPPLPLLPDFPGFAVNSLFYAGLWFLVFLTPTIRRHLRLRRGHCPRCNYDFRATQPSASCPECGRVPVLGPVPH